MQLPHPPLQLRDAAQEQRPYLRLWDTILVAATHAVTPTAAVAVVSGFVTLPLCGDHTAATHPTVVREMLLLLQLLLLLTMRLVEMGWRVVRCPSRALGCRDCSSCSTTGLCAWA